MTTGAAGPVPAPLQGPEMLRNFFFALIVVCASHDVVLAEEPATTGTLRGTVVSTQGGKPVAGAWVVVQGSEANAQTDENGRFELALAPGRHTLSILHMDFGTQDVETVEIVVGEVAEMRVELTPAAPQQDTLTTEAEAFAVEAAPPPPFAEKKPMGETVTETISAAEVSRAGDSDAASALRRVTGLTLVGGRYIYVRGLGERYSSTLLNGATLPSPEPERRVVPLDLIPSAVIEEMVIHKTYSPELPAEFGGGTIALRTRGIPEEFTLKLNATSGYRAGTTFERGLTYHGGRLDVLGVDDGTRALPTDVDRASSSQPLLERDQFSTRGYTAGELEVFGERMPNIWNTERAVTPPNLGVSGVLGDQLCLGPVVLGFLAATSFDHEWATVKRKRKYLVLGQNEQLEVAHDYDFETNEHNIGLGGVATVGASILDHHLITFTTLLNRATTDEARVYQGLNRDVGTDIRVTRLAWVERQLMAQQLTGTHVFPVLWDARLDWRYTYAQATRKEPDRREVRYDHEPGTSRWLLSDRPEGNQRLYSDLLEHNHDTGLDAQLPIPLFDGYRLTVRSGAMINWRTRQVDTRRFKYQHKGARSGNSDVISRPPEEIFTSENIGGDGFQLEEVTRQTDNYNATQVLVASYLGLDFPLSRAWRVSTGLRAEYALQKVRTYELFNPDGKPVESRLEGVDFLPATTVTWQLLDNMMVQGAAGISVSRPDFRELSPATYNDVTGGRQVFGNPDLERALIGSGDLRWEWHPAHAMVALSLFYKHFHKPIEQVVKPGAQQSISYANAKSADNVGLEAEFKLRYGIIHESLDPLYFAVNGAVIHSQVELDGNSGIQTSRRRALQGQSPYVFNAQLGYDDPRTSTNVAFVYNVQGPRIVEAGALGIPDVYEQPVHQVDVVASKKLPMGLVLSLKAQNLVDQPVTFTQGGQVVESFRRGRAVVVGVGM
ncbi:MAG: TonB-dependent receptor [Myxococcota bacterium]